MSQKVTGSIPDGIIWIFHWPNPFALCTMALGVTQPVTEMRARIISLGVKVDGVYG